jgi:CrcB protein
MLSYLSVCLGGAVGSGARFWTSGLVAQKIGQTFPFGTLVVNVTGSLIIGVFAAMSAPEGRRMLSPWPANSL